MQLLSETGLGACIVLGVAVVYLFVMSIIIFLADEDTNDW